MKISKTRIICTEINIDNTNERNFINAVKKISVMLAISGVTGSTQQLLVFLNLLMMDAFLNVTAGAPSDASSLSHIDYF